MSWLGLSPVPHRQAPPSGTPFPVGDTFSLEGNVLRRYRRIALWLLWFNAVSACSGSFGLLQAPSGEILDYDLKWLEGTPFRDYFWPAIILLAANGLLCIITAVLTHLSVT